MQSLMPNFSSMRAFTTSRVHLIFLNIQLRAVTFSNVHLGFRLTKIDFTTQYARKYLEYIDEISISKYNEHVRIYFEDGGIRHAVPVFRKEL